MGAENSCCCKGPPLVSEPPMQTSIATNATDEVSQSLEDHARSDKIRSTVVHPDGHRDISDAQDQAKLSAIKGGGRRAGVAAEAMSTDALQDYVKPVYKKDAATEAKLTNAMKTNDKLQVLFGHLDGAVLQDVVNAFQEVSLRQGEDIIVQGDQGECLYIIKEGSVDVFVARPGADGQIQKGDRGSKVVTLGSGALFGELALMYSAPRAATVTIASPECKCFKLDRMPFKMLLAASSQAMHQQYEGWLAEMDIFKSLNQYELSRLSELMQSELLDAGEEIIKQGESGDKFYILEDGTCSAYISGPNGEKKVKDYLKQGDYFGEIALLCDQPRKATVRATGEGCSVLSVSKEDFTSVLGPIADILRKDLDKYPQYAQFL